LSSSLHSDSDNRSHSASVQKEEVAKKEKDLFWRGTRIILVEDREIEKPEGEITITKPFINT